MHALLEIHSIKYLYPVASLHKGIANFIDNG
jgi:hypothetical protein